MKRALVALGCRVREYSPVGELLPGMSYLVRRLLENTSNEGFLRAKFSENASSAELLRDPRQVITAPGGNGVVSPNGAAVQQPQVTVPARETPPGDTYVNAPLVNFVYRD
jgi:delta 1-pyrroline-5-carboxylate dehydrogenase